MYVGNDTHKEKNLSAYFSNALHGASDVLGGVLEAVQVPAGYLGHNVVEAGLEAGGGGFGGGIFYGGQRDTQR